MKAEDFKEIVKEQFKLCENLLGIRAEDYAKHGQDRLAQFKREAGLIGSNDYFVCIALMGKHTTKLCDMVKALGKRQHYTKEQWEEVLTDHINYLLLLKGLLVDGGEIQ